MRVIVSIFLISMIKLDDNGTCSAGTDTKCQRCNGEVCEACYESYFNTTTKSCTDPSTEVDDCKAYSDANTCSSCDFGHYLDGNQCKETTIDNCSTVLFQNNTETCQVCEGDGIPSNDGKACNEVAQGVSNCAKHSVGGICSECNSDFTLLMNGLNFSCIAEIDGCFSAKVENNVNECMIC